MITPVLAKSLALAVAFWQPPCAPTIHTLPSSPFGGDGEAPPGQCEVILRRDWRDQLGGEYACRVVVHEVGHIAGRQHVADPHNIMFGGPGPLPDFPGCIQAAGYKTAGQIWRERRESRRRRRRR